MFKHQKILINIGPCNALHLCVCISPWLKRIDDRTNLLYKSNERKKKYVYQTNCGDLGEGKVRRREKKNNELQSRWNAIHRFNMRVNYFSVEIEQCYSFHYYCYSAPYAHWMVWKKNAIVSWNVCHWHEWCDARILSTLCIVLCVKMWVWYVNCINCRFFRYKKWHTRKLVKMKSTRREFSQFKGLCLSYSCYSVHVCVCVHCNRCI